MAVHTVDSIEEAIAFINKHGSHHTDCIITRDEAAAGKFFALVDSAGVYQNCSTRFADGYRYGFGAVSYTHLPAQCFTGRCALAETASRSAFSNSARW